MSTTAVGLYFALMLHACGRLLSKSRVLSPATCKCRLSSMSKMHFTAVCVWERATMADGLMLHACCAHEQSSGGFACCLLQASLAP